MRLIGLTALVLVAFAANSLLNRAAVGNGEMEALTFAVIRAAAGALMLAGLVAIRRKGLQLIGPKRVVGAASLTAYLVGFSLAYIAMDAGLGALVLFGAVQVTMFAGGVLGGEEPPLRRWLGAAVAFAGLAWLIWPAGAVQIPLWAAGAMLAAGIGWGVYSLAGRGAEDPLAETAANFIWAVPLCAVAALALLDASDLTRGTPSAWALAVLSGAVTSGLGYALWYAVLPALGASVAGLLQLSVPVIAAVGGVALLSEDISLRMLGAGALVIGGIAYGLGRPQRMSGSSGS